MALGPSQIDPKIDQKSIENLIGKVIQKMIGLGSDFGSVFGRQDGSKTGSRGRKDAKTAPRGRQDGPGEAPRRLQEASKKRIPDTWLRFRPPRVPKIPLGPLQERLLIAFSMIIWSELDLSGLNLT